MVKSLNLIFSISGFLLLFLPPLEIFAQKYIPVNFEKGVWIDEGYVKEMSRSKSQFYCKRDTVVEGNDVFRLYELDGWPKIIEPGYDIYGPTLVGYIFENENKQVMFKYKDDPDFMMAYDFNIELGDTIDQGGYMFIVNDIDSVEYCGRYHKRYINNLRPGALFPYTLTEGIGFANGLLGFYGIIEGEAYEFLLCYTEWENSECAECEILVGENEKLVTSSVYPNPARESIRITSNSPIASLTLYNITGESVYVQEDIYVSSVEVQINGLPQGLYLIRIEHLDKYTSTSRFIKN